MNSKVGPPASSSINYLRHQQVDLGVVISPINSGLITEHVSGFQHGLWNFGVIDQKLGNKRQIGVKGCQCHGKVSINLPGVFVDSLGANENGSRAQRPQSLQGIQETRPGPHIVGVDGGICHISSWECNQSIRLSASAGPRPGPVIKSTATWATPA